MTELPREGRRIPIEHYIPEDLELHFANNITVQSTDCEFIIGFYQVQPPLVLGSQEERQTKLEKIESVPAKCIARIAIAPNRMAEFLEVMQENLEKFQAGQQNE